MPDPYASIAQPVASADPYAAIASSPAVGGGVGQRLRDNFASGLGITDNEGAKQFFEHPVNTLMKSLDAQGQLAIKAKDAYSKGDYKGALMYGLNYLVPFVGPQTAKAGEQLNEGDVAGGVARPAGAALPLIAGTPEGRAGLPATRGAIADTASAAKPAVATAARAASDVVSPDITGIVSPRLAYAQKALGRLADALDKSQMKHAATSAADDAVFPGASLPEKPPAEVLQAGVLQQGGKATTEPASALANVPIAKPQLPAGFQSAPQPYQAPTGTAENPLQRPTPPTPAEPARELPPAFQPAPKTMPPVPGTVDLPFKSLFELPASAANQAIKELGPTAPLADLTERANNIARLGELLNKGLSGKELEPNVPLREQLQASPGALPVKSTTRTAQGLDSATTSRPTSELPEPQPRNAPEPRESTAIKEFKYDPDAKEMHIQWKGNPPRTYIFGEVTPEQAGMFKNAESKGIAAKSIKDNNVHVATIIDGKRISVRPAKSESDFISPEEWQHGQEIETQVEGTARR